MKNLKLGLFALATALVLTPVAFADPIVGSLDVGGGNDQWTTTNITFTNVNATGRDFTGTFQTVFGNGTAAATILTNPITFNDPDKLIFEVGDYLATFTITNAINIVYDGVDFLNVTGSGYLTMAGYDDTRAVFNLTSTDTNSNRGASGSSGYSFVVTTYGVAVTPEPTSLLLLGSGMLGLAGMLRRKMAKRQI